MQSADLTVTMGLVESALEFTTVVPVTRSTKNCVVLYYINSTAVRATFKTRTRFEYEIKSLFVQQVLNAMEMTTDTQQTRSKSNSIMIVRSFIF